MKDQYIIGERERANLVVQLARFFYNYNIIYTYIYLFIIIYIDEILSVYADDRVAATDQWNIYYGLRPSPCINCNTLYATPAGPRGIPERIRRKLYVYFKNTTSTLRIGGIYRYNACSWPLEPRLQR